MENINIPIKIFIIPFLSVKKYPIRIPDIITTFENLKSIKNPKDKPERE